MIEADRPATARGREAANARARLWNQLPEHANPCPDACVWLDGMPHKSALPTEVNRHLEPVRAMHSYKMYALKKLGAMIGAEVLARAWAGVGSPVRSRGGREVRGLVFTEAFPDTRPASGGMQMLEESGWRE